MRRMFLLLTVLLALGGILLLPADPTHAEALPVCPYPQGKYYRPRIFPRYEAHNKRLLLVDLKTREIVQVVETSLDTVQFIGWSPDCRYFAVQRYQGKPEVIIWNLVTNTRAGVFSARRLYYSHLYWEETSRYAILPTGEDGAYIWDVETNNQFDFSKGFCWYPSVVMDLYPGVYFDYERQQLIAIGGIYGCNSYGGGEFAIIIDLRTGQKVAQLYNPYPDYPEFSGVNRFDIVGNSRKIIVSTTLYDLSPITIWDRDTMTYVQVNGQKWNGGHIYLSPDARYLIADYRGIRIWDLQNLPVKFEDRKPIYRLPYGYIYGYKSRFISPTVLEITEHNKTILFDLTTGKYIR